MTILHLGVVDIPYVAQTQHTAPAAPKPTKTGKPRKATIRRAALAYQAGSMGGGEPTTVSVAQALEKKYHILELFYEDNAQAIADAFANGMLGQLENVIIGGPLTANVFGTAESEIEESFRLFLELGIVESLGIPGVPTQAALDGVNHRLKSGRGERRPSFIDTGLFENSFRAWVEE